MKRFFALAAALTLALALSACAGPAAVETTAVETTAVETASEKMETPLPAETETAGSQAAMDRLRALLRQVAEESAPGDGPANARLAAQILDWCGEYQNTQWEQQAAAEFAASLDETARARFEAEQLPAVYEMAEQLTGDGAEALLADIGYTPAFPWGQAPNAFSALYAALGLELPDWDGPSCAASILELTDRMPYLLDWDGDGLADTIELYELEEPGLTSDFQYALRLQSGGGCWEFEDLCIGWDPTVFLSDPDQDGVSELFVCGDVASNDYQTYCWKLTEQGPEPVPFAPDPRYEELAQEEFYGVGRLIGLGDLQDLILESSVYVLGTYSGARPYRLSGGRIAPVEGTIWDLTENKYVLTTAAELEAQPTEGRNGADTGEPVRLPAGTDLVLTGTDAASAVWFETDGGLFGRFALVYGDASWTVAGVEEYEAFDALPYAD